MVIVLPVVIWMDTSDTAWMSHLRKDKYSENMEIITTAKTIATVILIIKSLHNMS